jgi:hypothetical protein
MATRFVAGDQETFQKRREKLLEARHYWFNCKIGRATEAYW